MDPDTDSSAAASAPPAGPEDGRIRLRFWGTRGSIPSPGPTTARYGGNTPCLELLTAGRRYILDAGSGIRALGKNVLGSGESMRATLFLTHFHWDHIQGFPFLRPLYSPDVRLHVVGPKQGELDVRTLLQGQMGPIHFPVPLDALQAEMTFEHLNDGDWTDDGIELSAMRVRHPSFAVGYRIRAGKLGLCYVPDNELAGRDYDLGPHWRRDFVEFLSGADLLIHDAMYTREEYDSRMGWGHSTFEQCLDLALEAGVRRLFLFHHDPERTDEALDALVERYREEAARQGPLQVDAAVEGAVLEL